MPQAIVPSPTMIAHWGIIALYLSIAMLILRSAGLAFGPLVLKKSPGAYAFFGACWTFLKLAINDVFGVLGKTAPVVTQQTEVQTRTVQTETVQTETEKK